jgi:hypothetical protein
MLKALKVYMVLTMIYSSVLDPLISRGLTAPLFAKSSMEPTVALKLGMDKIEVYEAVK